MALTSLRGYEEGAGDLLSVCSSLPPSRPDFPRYDGSKPQGTEQASALAGREQNRKAWWQQWSGLGPWSSFVRLVAQGDIHRDRTILCPLPAFSLWGPGSRLSRCPALTTSDHVPFSPVVSSEHFPSTVPRGNGPVSEVSIWVEEIFGQVGRSFAVPPFLRTPESSTLWTAVF